MNISVKTKGDFKHTENFLDRMKNFRLKQKLEKYGRLGVEALTAATPKDTGKTAESWNYEIRNNGKGLELVWTNDNSNQGIPIIVLLVYGHSTRNGGYVQGRDFINPAMRPVFDKIAEEVWAEVTKA